MNILERDLLVMHLAFWYEMVVRDVCVCIQI